MLMTAAVLAEICSALPLSGSIYIWAAESAGRPEYARFFGFVVAWWSCTSWMTYAASNCQVSVFVRCWLHTLSNNPIIIRQPPILSYPNWQYGKFPSRGVSQTKTSNGEPSFGRSQKVCSFYPCSSIIYPQKCILTSSNSGSVS
jgi:hypothetical protein